MNKEELLERFQKSVKDLELIGKPASSKTREEISKFIIEEIEKINKNKNFRWLYDDTFYDKLEVVCDESNNTSEDIMNDLIKFDFVFKK